LNGFINASRKFSMQPTFFRFLSFALLLALLAACAGPAPVVTETAPVPTISATPTSVHAQLPQAGAYETGQYPNLFAEYLGKSEAETQAKIEAAFQQLFYGDDVSERVYYPVGADMAYMLDTGNDDVRSEGMSYGMMIAVQMNKKEEFDRLWKWAKTYMYQTDGGYKGYFAWHCKTDGTQLAANPASDGEVWFVMALFFADARWGSGEGIFNYRAEAQSILDVALNARELGGDLATNLFDPETKQVVFVPQLGQNSKFTDASYHMPHFYELWARWADKNNDFWRDAAIASRDFLPKAVHPQTGLAPNYSYFDGRPYNDDYHGQFRYDAFRVGANIGMDYVWFYPSAWYREQANRQLTFFTSQGINDYVAEYALDGTPLAGHRSTGLIATNAVLAHAADPEIGQPFVQALWDAAIPTGKYRYYDGLLYMLGLLQASGNFRIYEPGVTPRAETPPPPPRAVEGRFAPTTGKALLMLGPDAGAVNAYFDKVVSAPGGVNLDVALDAPDLEALAALATKYPNSVLSVGLTLGGLADALVAGSAPEQLGLLLDALASYSRPVFLRIEPQFDLAASGLGTQDYLTAWQTVHNEIQARGSANLALVWHSAAACESPFGGYPLEAWYPGDDLVDWVALSYGPESGQCEGQSAEAVLQFARERYKPVLLVAAPMPGELEQIFGLVRANNDVIRALLYLNTAPELFETPEFLSGWKSETSQPFWLRGGRGLFSALGY
jgi:oligosaccharide reducing-end xylanase